MRGGIISSGMGISGFSLNSTLLIRLLPLFPGLTQIKQMDEHIEDVCAVALTAPKKNYFYRRASNSRLHG
jgi:hypothetical protein